MLISELDYIVLNKDKLLASIHFMLDSTNNRLNSSRQNSFNKNHTSLLILLQQYDLSILVSTGNLS